MTAPAPTLLIRIRLLRDRRSDLLLAGSGDLPGLHVHAYSPAEIDIKLPAAIRELLELRGATIDRIDTADADAKGFVMWPSTYRVSCIEMPVSGTFGRETDA
jgi:hypothetical protein